MAVLRREMVIWLAENSGRSWLTSDIRWRREWSGKIPEKGQYIMTAKQMCEERGPWAWLSERSVMMTMCGMGKAIPEAAPVTSVCKQYFSKKSPERRKSSERKCEKEKICQATSEKTGCVSIGLRKRPNVWWENMQYILMANMSPNMRRENIEKWKKENIFALKGGAEEEARANEAKTPWENISMYEKWKWRLETATGMYSQLWNNVMYESSSNAQYGEWACEKPGAICRKATAGMAAAWLPMKIIKRNM